MFCGLNFYVARASHGKRRKPASKLAQEGNKKTERWKMNNYEKIVNNTNKNAINMLINKVNLTNISSKYRKLTMSTNNQLDATFLFLSVCQHSQIFSSSRCFSIYKNQKYFQLLINFQVMNDGKKINQMKES